MESPRPAHIPPVHESSRASRWPALLALLAVVALAGEESSAADLGVALAAWRPASWLPSIGDAAAAGAGSLAPRGRCLFFAAGAAFRSKPRPGDASIGSPLAAPHQHLAVASQLAFLADLEARHGMRCEISVSTFTGSAELDEELRGAYGATGLQLRRFEALERQPSLNEMFLSAFSPALVSDDGADATSDAVAYDFAIYMRVDVMLRPFFTEVFDPRWDTTRFAFIEWFAPPGGWDRTAVGSYVWNTTHPRIADMLMFVPRRNFETVPMGGIAHEAWSNLLKKGVPRSAGDVMLRTYHDADSAKDWNPLYELANRPETLTWHNAGFFWPEGGDFLRPVFDPGLASNDCFAAGAYAQVLARATKAAASTASGGTGAEGRPAGPAVNGA